MTRDKREILETLKFELDFLEQGGYGRSVRTPWQPTSTFQDSPSCLNFNDPGQPHACDECLLFDFVPENARSETIPCHHIPVGPSGETVSAMEQQGNDFRMQEALRTWLRAAIARLEAQLALETKSA